MSIRFEKIWVQQCKATKGIKRRFGVENALDYLIHEKLLNFADAAEERPEFARELPRFLALVWQILTHTNPPAVRKSSRSNRQSASPRLETAEDPEVTYEGGRLNSIAAVPERLTRSDSNGEPCDGIDGAWQALAVSRTTRSTANGR